MRISSLLAFASALLLSIGLGAAVRVLATKIGAVVPVRSSRWHRAPTPTLGGIAIAGATISVVLVAMFRWGTIPRDALPMLLVMGTSAALFVVGLVDDRLQLTPLAKLLATLVSGAVLVFGLRETLGASVSWWQMIIAIVWYAGIAHAFNLLDNMDGLAGGVAFVSALGLMAVFGPALGHPMRVLLLALLGGTAGFLAWNVKPARLFMGDCGSLFLGAMMAGVSLAVLHQPGADIGLDAVIVCLILIVPLFDTSFVVVLRRLADRPTSRGGTDHLSHRLVSLGLSERTAVAVLYVIGLMGGATALLVHDGGPRLLSIAVLFVLAVLLVALYLARVPAYEGEDLRALKHASFGRFVRDVAFRWHAAEMLLDVVLIATMYYLAFTLRFEDEGRKIAILFPAFVSSLPIVLVCTLVALYVSGAYSRLWGTFGMRDVLAVVRGVALGSVTSVFLVTYLYRFEDISRGVFVIAAALLTLALLAARGSFRMMGEAAGGRNGQARRVLVYGAGSAGQLLVREMRANAEWRMNPVAFLDDDPVKFRRRLLGVMVRGTLESLENVIRQSRVEDVVLSSTKITSDHECRLREVCRRHDIRVRRFRLEITE
jgi:UDP-GlcNAc:undecaprenyl-phosphate GlcNAc-1-phosphate transferase